MLVLLLLSREDLPSVQIMRRMQEETGQTITLVSPYMLFYRLIESGYIIEAYKKIAPDGRRRQYYQITQEGRCYLEGLIALYRRLTEGVERALEKGMGLPEPSRTAEEERSPAAIGPEVKERRLMSPCVGQGTCDAVRRYWLNPPERLPFRQEEDSPGTPEGFMVN